MLIKGVFRRVAKLYPEKLGGDSKNRWTADRRADISKGNMNRVSGKMVNRAKTTFLAAFWAYHESRAG